MITYVYETIPPASSEEEPRQFEFAQKMSDPPLQNDPVSGFPVKRIITGGFGFTGLSGQPRQHSCHGGCCHE
jgi:hypothetical protein